MTEIIVIWLVGAVAFAVIAFPADLDELLDALLFIVLAVAMALLWPVVVLSLLSGKLGDALHRWSRR